MAELPDLDALTKDLDPQSRAVVVLLHGMLSSLLAQFEATTAKLEAENADLKRLLFGKKAERKVMPSVRREAARRAKAKETAEASEARKEKSLERRRGRRAKRRTLPVVEARIAVPDGERTCPKCGSSELRPLGEGAVSEQYEYVPGRLVRKRIVREKLACRCGEAVVTAPAPPQVTDGAEHGPGLQAHVVVSKCADAIPLYRQARRLERAGVPASRSTLCDLFHRSAQLLRPLRDRLLEIVAEDEHTSADETPLPVMHEGGCRRGYQWTFVAEPVIAYVYSPTRSGQTPARVLGGTKGTLQVDGYTGYNRVTTPEGRTRVGCWAHVRRGFFNALATAPDEAGEMMDLIADLYAVEHRAEEAGVVGSEAHRVLRDHDSRAIVERIRQWLDDEAPGHPPKSPLGKAIGYANGQWKTLMVFLDDAKVAIDNNVSERSLRATALGRKNFLFVGNDAAGENLSVLQSLVSTCQACGVNPQAYLEDVLVRVQTHPAKDIDALLPMHWRPAGERAPPPS